MKKTHTNKPDLSQQGELVIGPTSPIQKSLKILHIFFGTQPDTNLASAASKRTSLLIANHLFSLIEACGLLNGSGMHSSAVVLLRSLEDALDVFSAVSSVPGAAERWEKHDLKPSDAAKLWVKFCGNPTVANGKTLSDYRKELRGSFNKYSHASYELCLWNLYFKPNATALSDQGVTGTIEINCPRRVINSNGHSIDAHLTAHHLEFIEAIKFSYSVALNKFSNAKELELLEKEIDTIMQRHASHGCQNVQEPAELRKLKK